MVVLDYDNMKMTIISRNFTAKCLVEVLRGIGDFEKYHAAEKLRKDGFTQTDKAAVGVEIATAISALASVTDNYLRHNEPEEVEEQPTPVKVDDKPFVM